jgi:hypothetical protein
MIKPEDVTTDIYASRAYDEMKTGVILSGALGIGAIVVASQIEAPQEVTVGIGAAGGAALMVAYNCGRKAMAYYRRGMEILGEAEGR